MEKKAKKKVTFNVDDDLYFEYRKILLEKRTNASADFVKHMKKTIDSGKNKEE